MSLQNSNISRRRSAPSLVLAAVALGALSAALSACRHDYLDRRDAATLGAGEAAAFNRVTHTRHPWPRRASETHAPTDGEVVRHAVEGYRAEPGSTQDRTRRSGPGDARASSFD